MARIRLLPVVKVLLLILAVGGFFWRNALFEQYSRQGAVSASGEYQWALNNHGSIRYITAAQQDRLDWLRYASLGLLGAAIAAEWLQHRRRGPDAPGA